jgi:hypothetical protein
MLPMSWGLKLLRQRSIAPGQWTSVFAVLTVAAQVGNFNVVAIAIAIAIAVAVFASLNSL